MEENQEYERFDLENDYEGGEFYEGEFLFAKKRQKRAQTADDRLYGVFQGSSDEEDGGSRRRRGRGQKQEADYTKPVGFVSKGVVVSSDDKPENVESSERAGLGASGMGTPGATGGLGFQPQNPAQDGDSDEEKLVLPNGFGKRIKQGAEERRRAKERDKKREKGGTMAAADSKETPVFEKFTKGIGSKLMAAMGYKPGEGLGREKQGIAKPIEAKLRPKNMGLGHNDYREHSLLPPQPEPKPAPAQPASKPAAASEGAKLWKRKNAADRVRRVYRTAEEALAEAADRPAEPRATILDMRGPQARVVTNLEHLNVAEETDAGEATPMPELQHNLRLLTDLAEADIQRLDARLRHEKDTAVVLGREQQRLQAEADGAQRRAERVQELLRAVEECARPGGPPAQAQQAFQRLKAAFPEEYVLYNIAAAALAQALPALQAQLAGWRPLADPARGSTAIAPWRPLLENTEMRDAIFYDALEAGQDPYLRLLGAVLVPRLQSAVTNEWEPRDPEPMIGFLEEWTGLLPPPLERHVLDSLVFPKLKRAVDGWQPTAETVRLHAWLHPWLPSLGARLEEVYPGIRHKLASALTQWHPSDQSALLLLAPWHTVFDPKDWDALMARSILPKLAWALTDLLAINPLAQDLAPLHWVLAWAPYLPRATLVALLERCFFPKWHAVLTHWLANGPDFDEVTRWYLGWKAQLPPDLQDDERVRAQLNAALNAMNSAVDGAPQPPYDAAAAAAGNGAYGAYAVPPQPAPQPPLPADYYSAPGTAAADMTLRQLVEQFAGESGLDFLPRVGRSHEGLQVYAFGGVSIVMDNAQNLLRAQVGDRWVPLSLEGLLAEQRKRAAGRSR